MGADEMFEWMAYELMQNTEYREKLDKNIELDRQRALSDVERAEMIKAMFGSMS
jgi:hypothetical protein